jgi:alkylhydroperoxidase family enzyme
MLLGDQAIEPTLSDWRTASLSPAVRAAFGLIEVLTLDPDRVGVEHVSALREAGVDDDAADHAVFVCAGFNVIDRIADAVAFFVPTNFQKGVPIIARFGYRWLSGTWPADSGLPPKGPGRREGLVRRLEDAVLRSPGMLDPAVRQAIADERDVPADFATYVRKVFRHAYKVTDEDVAELRAAGRSEDEIFEATLAAALGAGRLRLRAGLAAIRSFSSRAPESSVEARSAG